MNSQIERRSLALLAGLVTLSWGCTETVRIVVERDAGPDASALDAEVDAGVDAGVLREHCEIAGDSWRMLPAVATGDSPRSITAITAAPGEDLVIGGFDELHRLDTDRFVPVDRTGLPEPLQVRALSWHQGELWVGLSPREGDTVFHRVGDGWVGAGNPGTARSLLSVGEALFAFNGFALFRHEEGTWNPVAEAEGIVDAVRSAGFLYVSIRPVTGPPVVRRTADGSSWETVPVEGEYEFDLVAAGTRVYLTNLTSDATRVLLDETVAEPRFVAAGFPVGDPVLEWASPAGPRLGRLANELYYAAAEGAPWRAEPDLDVRPQTNGLTEDWPAAAYEGALVVVSQIPFSTDSTVLAATGDAAFRALASAAVPTPVETILSDGRELFAFAAGEDALPDLFRYELTGTSEGWSSVSAGLPRGDVGELPYAGVLGAAVAPRGQSFGRGVLITRPRVLDSLGPAISTDGGETWAPMAEGYPSYKSSAGRAYRDFHSHALDARGRVVLGTVGGLTSICCTGGMAPFRDLPGSGIWRATPGALWAPLNAGVPVEAGPDDLGGPPFRSDVGALVRADGELYATLFARGVFRLDADRWVEDRQGLPIEGEPELGALAGAPIAVYPEAIYHRLDGTWSALGLPSDLGPIQAWAARGNLLVVADGRLHTSLDGGASWELSTSAGEASSTLQLLTLVNEEGAGAIVGRSAEHRIFRLPIQCELQP